MRRQAIFASILLPALLGQSTFHVETRLVEINVVVRDKHGPVADLTKNDFLLTDAGKPREIAVFTINKTGTNATNAANRTKPSPTFFANRGETPPNITVILLDRLNTFSTTAAVPDEEHTQWREDLAIAYARKQLLRFVSTMDTNDRVAIYSLGEGLEVLTDFTSDRSRLQSILEAYKPVSLTKRDDVAPLPIHTPAPGKFNAKIDADRQELAAFHNRDRAQTTVSVLSQIAAHLASVPSRKNLVWLTADLPVSGAVGRILDRAGIAIYPVDARGLLDRAPPDSDDPGVSVMFGRGDPARQQMEPAGIPAMRQLAEETGGRAFLNNNDLAGAVRAAIADGEVSYTLGFYVDAASLDGKFHEIKLRLKHHEPELRYPRGYFAEPQSGEKLIDAITSPLEFSAVGLTARLERPAPGALEIHGAIDYADLNLSAQGIGSFELFAIEQDTAGALLSRTHTHYDVRLTDQMAAGYRKSGVPFTLTIAPQSGLKVLRIIATVPNSNIGSVIIPVQH